MNHIFLQYKKHTLDNQGYDQHFAHVKDCPKGLL